MNAIIIAANLSAPPLSLPRNCVAFQVELPASSPHCRQAHCHGPRSRSANTALN